jgi:amino acid adenylation domain-containing protein
LEDFLNTDRSLDENSSQQSHEDTGIPGETISPAAQSEQGVIVDTWTTARGDYPTDKCLHQLFEAWAERAPDAVALIYDELQMTYAQINARSNQLAHHLRRTGVRLETVVSICIERSVDLVIAILGVLKAGAAYLPLDPAYPRDRLAFMFADSKTHLLLTHQSLLEHVSPFAAQTICLDTDWEKISEESDRNISTNVQPENLAYIIYTSGTTGNPKGVLLDHRGRVNNLFDLNQRFHVGPQDRLLSLSSLNFDMSVYDILGILGAGGSVVLPTKSAERDPSLWVYLMTKHCVSLWQSVPALLEMLVGHLSSHPETVPYTLRLALLGGDWLPVSLPDQLTSLIEHVQIVNLGGATEASVHSTIYPIKQVNPLWKSIPYGRPMTNQSCYVLDADLRLCPVGVTGDLYIGGIGLARGYFNRAQLTAEKFIPHPFATEPGSRLYKTGDIARFLPDGNLELLGRADFQVKMNGIRIELGEIETLLLHHPAVQKAIVVAQRNHNQNKRLVAYIIPEEKQALAQQQHEPYEQTALANQAALHSTLRHYLQTQLPQPLVPQAFVFMDTFPLTSNGKVDRRSLPDPQGNRPDLAVNYVAPRTPTEELLADIWAQVLKIDRVGIYDNFFDLGGDSLLIMRVIAQVRKTLQVDLSPNSFFTFPTIATQAEQCAANQQEERSTPGISLLPTARPAAVPLSFGQEGLWFINQVAPDMIAYNVPLLLHIHGAFHISALEESLNEIIRRHEILHTTFMQMGQQTIQVVDPVYHLSLPVTDLSRQPAEEQKRHFTQFIQQPFNLSQGPFFRAQLIKIQEDEHILCLNLHHIIIDGWSNEVLLHELAALYQARIRGIAAPLPALPLQYADFVLWQRQHIQDETLADLLSYWQEQLHDALFPLPLPTDHARPAQPSYRGATYRFQLSPQQSQQLRLLSRQENCTLFMTLLAAVQMLLARYTNTGDIVIGSPSANRMYDELAPLIGYFINMLVLRTDLSGNPTVREVLRRVREVTLGAYAHQDMPFELLVQHLKPQRDMRYPMPFFQVGFQLLNAPQPVHLHQARIELMEVETGTAKFDLNIEFEETPQTLKGLIEYSTDLFEATTIEHMAGHLQQLLAGMTSNPAQRLDDLPLLTPQESEQLLTAWNTAKIECLHDQSLSSLFAAQVQRTPDTIAVIGEHEHLSYQYIDERANQLTYLLQEAGVRLNTLVAVCLERTPDLAIALLAILQAGGAYIPLDPHAPTERLKVMLDESQATCVLTRAAFASHFQSCECTLICVDQIWTTLAQYTGNTPRGAQHTESQVYTIFTSGSTGKPKGAGVSQRSFLNLLSWFTQDFHLGTEDRSLIISSVSFDLTQKDIFAPLLSGGCVHLFAADFFDVDAITRTIQEQGITLLNCTPSAFYPLLDSAEEKSWSALSSLRVVFLGGEPILMPRLLRWLQAEGRTTEVVNTYGPTECTDVVAFHRLDRAAKTGPVPLGRAITNTQLYILNTQLQPVPIGVPGELCIAGESVGNGYRNDQALTALKFLPNPYGLQPGGRLYKTGDMARYLRDGTIEFIGRIDRQVKIRGYRIEPGEIEAALSSHPDVQEAVVLQQEIEPEGPYLVAYLIFAPDRQVSEHEMRHYLQALLPQYMIPGHFVTMQQWPLTPNGKLDRNALPLPCRGVIEQSQGYQAPRNALEEVIASVWADAFGARFVSVNDHFLDMGGHSLLAIQIILRLRDLFGIEVPFHMLFQAPTVAMLAEYIAAACREAGMDALDIAQQEQSNSRSSENSIRPRSTSGPLPLSWAQERLWFLDQFMPDSPMYKVSMNMRLQGPLQIHLLEQSLTMLLQRHEILRTTFPTNNSVPIQAIAPSLAISIPVIDLQGVVDLPRLHEMAEQLAGQGTAFPFDLSRGPLVYGAVIRLAPHIHIFVLTMHHVIFDGWSTRVLWRELNTIYSALVARHAWQLPPLPIQYADFALWQRTQWQSSHLQKQLAYWMRHLAGMPPLLNLPLDRPRPARQTFLGASLYHTLSPAITEALKRLGRQYNMSLFMVLLAGFQILLASITGLRDIVVGVPTANRTRSELEGLIGFFVNTLVLRADLSGDPRLPELLQRIRDACIHAYNHQEVPFEKLVESLHPIRSMSYTPLVQVTIQMLADPLIPPRLGDLDLSPLPIETSSTQFDLSLEILEKADGLLIEAIYSVDLFEARSIQQLVRGYQYVLEALLRDPEQRLSALLQSISEDVVSHKAHPGKAQAPQEDTVDNAIQEHPSQNISYLDTLSDDDVSLLLESMLTEETSEGELNLSSSDDYDGRSR